MLKHNFKIGNKVRLKDPKDFPHLGSNVLTIIDFDDEFVLVCDGRIKEGFPLYIYEIEPVFTKGQQLLFAFMGEF